MLHSLRSRRLLEGFRGSVPCNVDALVDVIVRLGHLADEVPDIIELDANPVLVTSDGAIAVDVKIRIASNDEAADPLRAYDTDVRFLRRG